MTAAASDIWAGPMQAVPVLETERLRLRAPTRADFDLFAETLMSDRARYMDGPMSYARAWHDFAADAASWILNGFGPWSIEEKASGAYCGGVLLHHPPLFPEREFGWALQAEAEGRGFAFEAACAVRDFAFRRLGWRTLVSYIDAGNARSIALAERLGATRDDAAAKPQGDPTCLVYRHSEAAAQSGGTKR